jgi:hypothetical protein
MRTAAILLTFKQCCGSGTGSGPQDPESGMEKFWTESGINIPYHISKSLITILGLKIFKFFVADPDSCLPSIRDENIRIRDSG